MMARRHNSVVENIVSQIEEAGYGVFIHLLNARDYGVPQDRKRVFYVGFMKALNIKFEPPKPYEFKDVIFDLNNSAIPALEKIKQIVITVKFWIMNTLLVPIRQYLWVEIELDKGMNWNLRSRYLVDSVNFIHKQQLCQSRQKYIWTW